MVAKRTNEPVEVFLSYSHKDEELRNELVKHLSALKRAGIITDWHDRKITAGTEWEGQIDKHLNSAKVILLLISADFLASDYCSGKELTRAMWRHSRKLARVIPIIVRSVDWKGSPFAKLQALPTDAKPITSWANRDEAFTDVAQGIRRAVTEITAPAKAKAGPTAGTRPTGSKSQRSATSPPSNTSRTKVQVETEGKAPTRRRPTSTAKSPAPQPSKPAPARQPKTEAPGVTEDSLSAPSARQHLSNAFADRPKANMGVVWLQVVWASRRTDAAIKPTLFMDEDFVQRVQSLAHEGKPPLLTYGVPNQEHANTTRLKIVQHQSTGRASAGQDLVELALYANGTLSIALNVTNLKGQDHRDFFAGMRINPDDVQKRLEQAWSFAARWWNHHLGARAKRLMSFVYNVGLFDTANCQFERLPQGGYSNSFTHPILMRSRPNPLLAYEEPKAISRSLVVNRSSEIRDVVKLLQMRFNES
jgi:hypothetical protein